jgi:outer membrane protein TolC
VITLLLIAQALPPVQAVQPPPESQFAPTLAVTATGRYNDPPTSSTGDKGTWAVALSLTLPLYDGGFRYVALKDADSQLRQARAQTRSQGTRVEDELRRALLDLDSARALRVGGGSK